MLRLLRLVATGAAERLLRGLSGVWQWLVSDWRNGPLVWFIVLFLVNSWIITPRLRAQRDEAQAALAAETEAFDQTIVNIVTASAEALRRAKANAERVKAEQEKITDATLTDLRADHAALRARFDRLRAGATRTDPRRADPSGLSGAGNAPGGAAGTAPDHDLRPAGDLGPQPLCPSQLICLTIDEAEQASKDAHNHNALIDWALGQSAVRFTPEETAE